MELLKCPDCENTINDNDVVCKYCGFDIEMYKTAFGRFLNEIESEEQRKQEAANQPNVKTIYVNAPQDTNTSVNVPKCPTCSSTSLSRISGFERVANAVMWGILGNRRKYHWHCNNCGYEW